MSESRGGSDRIKKGLLVNGDPYTIPVISRSPGYTDCDVLCLDEFSNGQEAHLAALSSQEVDIYGR